MAAICHRKKSNNVEDDENNTEEELEEIKQEQLQQHDNEGDDCIEKDNQKVNDDNGDEDDDDKNPFNLEQFDERTVMNQQQREIEQLLQLIKQTQPKDDILAIEIMQKLDNFVDLLMKTTQENQNVSQTPSVTSTTMIASYPYPPVQRTGFIRNRDRPYADYNHFDRSTIAQMFEFKFDSTNSNTQQQQQQQQSLRLNTKSFAITS